MESGETNGGRGHPITFSGNGGDTSLIGYVVVVAQNVPSITTHWLCERIVLVKTRFNKGPHVVEAVRTLEDVLRRMQGHQVKKTAMMRQLHVYANLNGVAQERESRNCLPLLAISAFYRPAPKPDAEPRGASGQKAMSNVLRATIIAAAYLYLPKTSIAGTALLTIRSVDETVGRDSWPSNPFLANEPHLHQLRERDIQHECHEQ
jgi:hypothetical protein